MAVYLLPDGTTVIETGTAIYPVAWGTVVETTSSATGKLLLRLVTEGLYVGSAT